MSPLDPLPATHLLTYPPNWATGRAVRRALRPPHDINRQQNMHAEQARLSRSGNTLYLDQGRIIVSDASQQPRTAVELHALLSH